MALQFSPMHRPDLRATQGRSLKCLLQDALIPALKLSSSLTTNVCFFLLAAIGLGLKIAHIVAEIAFVTTTGLISEAASAYDGTVQASHAPLTPSNPAHSAADHSPTPLRPL